MQMPEHEPSHPVSTEGTSLRRRIVAGVLSLLVGFALMGLKFSIYWMTRSTAVLSDALESIINVAASAFALGSIILSAKPPDETHPYGHGKIEFFSAGFEGALIIVAAVGIAWTAWPQILKPHELPQLELGLMLLLGTSLINLALGIGLIRVGKRTQSLVLVADGKHVLTDVYTSAGVLLGLVLVHQTGWFWLDGVVACFVALNILIVGSKLVWESFAGLMHASDPGLLEEISRLINSHRRATWIDVHRLRAWRAGSRIQVDLHLILPKDLSLKDAHDEATMLQNILKSHLAGKVEAVIHAEPCVEPECAICGYDPCGLRREPVFQQRIWRRETLTAMAGEELREGRPEDGEKPS